MTRHLDEAMSRRGARRIVYFHTDHFEPALHARGRRDGDHLRRRADAMATFDRRMAALPHAARLSLFYLPTLLLGEARPGDIAVPGDRLGIRPRTDEERRWTEDAWRGFDPARRFDIQVHMHHERITRVDGGSPQPWATDDAALDRARFDLALTETLRRVRGDTGRTLDRWFFIHGKWALNASDPSVCTITDEIARLRKAGCLGDFSFPAGRDHVDAKWGMPMLVRPVDAPRGYDLPEADPVPPGAGDHADRFFVWATRLSAADSSIDLDPQGELRNAADPTGWARRLIERGVRGGDTIYVKTHAHSLGSAYLQPTAAHPSGCLPHEHEGVRALIDLLADAAAHGGGRLDFLNAGEVYAELLATAPDNDAARDEATGAPPRAFALAERAGLSTLADRAAAAGVDQGGLGAHGAGLLARGRLLGTAEREAAHLAIDLLPAGRPVVHLVSGFGALGLALAETGRQVILLEPDRRRRAAGRAVVEAATAIEPALAGRVSASDFALATALETLPADAVFVLADADVSLTDALSDALLARLAAAPAVLLDTSRAFGLVRGGDTPFAQALAARRPDPPRLVRDLGDEGRFMLFTAGPTPVRWWRSLLPSRFRKRP